MHANETLIRAMDKAMASGDMETFFGSYTDDVVVHMAGRSSLAGEVRGKDQLQELFGQFMARAGEFSFEPHDYLASDEHGVVMQRSHYNRDGRRLDTNDVFIYHFRDGKISEFWMISENQADLDAFLG
jgi:ketosteroid isomerase-like protein